MLEAAFYVLKRTWPLVGVSRSRTGWWERWRSGERGGQHRRRSVSPPGTGAIQRQKRYADSVLELACLTKSARHWHRHEACCPKVNPSRKGHLRVDAIYSRRCATPTDRRRPRTGIRWSFQKTSISTGLLSNSYIYTTMPTCPRLRVRVAAASSPQDRTFVDSQFRLSSAD
jgi:hypothetical protein